MKYVISTIWYDMQIQIKHVATFFILFGAHMNIVFLINVKIVVLTKWSYMSLNYVDY